MIPQYHGWTVFPLRFSRTLVFRMQFAHDWVTHRWVVLGAEFAPWKRNYVSSCSRKEVVDTSAAYFTAVTSDVFLFAHGPVLFWGAFANSQKKKKRLLSSPCLSVRMEQLGSHWTDFHEIWYLSISRKSVEKIQVSLKSHNNKGYFTWRSMYLFDHVSLSSS